MAAFVQQMDQILGAGVVHGTRRERATPDLMPLVVAISFIGVCSICNSTFDLHVMIGFGVLGYVLRKPDITLVPLVLGLLPGADMENNLRRALSISGGLRRACGKLDLGGAVRLAGVPDRRQLAQRSR